MTKGVLVVFMVVYHSLNYSTHSYLGFHYLAFLPPSFIVITGFLIANIYLGRQDLHRRRLYQRLLVRGGKLFAVFTLLNVAAQLVRRSNHEGQPMGIGYFLEHAFEVYVSGDGRLVAFEVLLPISYLLLLSPVLLWIDQFHRLLLPGLAVALVGVLGWLEHQGGGGLNAHLISAGVVGAAIGRVVPFPQLSLLGRYCLPPLLAYVALEMAFDKSYLVQLGEACLALATIYGFSVRIGAQGWTQRRLEILGKYSLVSYIAQIGLLQIAARFMGRPEPGSPRFAGL